MPQCHVLFIYCDVDADGRVVHRRESIRDLIKAAGAYLAVVASENPPGHDIKSLGAGNDWHANIVLTINRKGEKFAASFTRLFQAMFNGKSMLMAWVEMAPQIPGYDHPDMPEAIMLAEAGHLVFARVG